MQRIFDEVKGTLAGFVGQRDDVTLVVRCGDGHSPVLAKALEEVEDAAASEMFWIHTDDFTTAHEYASALVNGFAAKHSAASLAMRQRGMAPWPVFPEHLLEESAPPATRLRELAAFSRELLPFPDEMTSVWCLFPITIADRAAWAALVASIVEHEFPMPWCHHLRFIVRDDEIGTPVGLRLAGWPRVRHYRPDLSDDAIARAMEAEADDESKPLEQRLQTLFMLANVDYANQRFSAALEKYALLLRYYAGVRDPTMTALVVNGMGEVHARMGNHDLASRCFETAWEPASQAPGPPVPVLLNIVLNLANLRMEQQQWAEAEGYYDVAQQFATLQRAPTTKVDCIENLGVCQYMQGKVEPALRSWHAGAHVAGELEMFAPRRRLLERLRAHYQQAEDGEHYWDVDRQIAALPPATAH